LSRAVKADEISVVEPTQPLRLARVKALGDRRFRPNYHKKVLKDTGKASNFI